MKNKTKLILFTVIIFLMSIIAVNKREILLTNNVFAKNISLSKKTVSKTKKTSAKKGKNLKSNLNKKPATDNKNNLSKITVTEVKVTDDMKYANESKVKTGVAKLYTYNGLNPKGKTVCVNAGHGSVKSSKAYTFCNPLHKAKFISATTSAGKTKSVAASMGTTMINGASEGDANLEVALGLRDKLLSNGYNVLMIRETKDTDLDNIARTVLANKYSDCHVSIHFDSTKSNKGAFCINVPDIPQYKEMEPVKSTWQLDDKLSKDIIQGLRNTNIKIYGNGLYPIDLTQTSYSTVATTDIELGDRITDYSKASVDKFSDGIVNGLNIFFGK